jgi:hypothetical protein
MKTRSPISKLWKLTLAAALLLWLAPALRPAQASPCPAVCGYTYDPVTHCCEAGPQYDCYDFCFTGN